MTDNTKKPTTFQADLARLPRPLVPLIERPQWANWRWVQKPNGVWQKPPFCSMQPDRNADVSDPTTWATFEEALDAVETRRAIGISYMLTKDDPFAATDIDNCRDPSTGSIDSWAQNFLDVGRNNYTEITPSGTGFRQWGLANGEKVHRKFSLNIDSKPVAAELFRRTNKALTITGLTLNPAIKELTNIDKVIDWSVIWGERRKAEAAKLAPIAGNGFNGGNGSGYSVDEIELIVREGAPAGKNRSDTFHTIIGHYLGCDWDVEQIFAHLQQFPNGIGGRYLGEGRLSAEITRSANKYAAGALPVSGTNGWVNGFEVKAPAPSELDDLDELDDDLSEDNPPTRNPAPDPELDDDLDEEPTQGPAPDPELNDDLGGEFDDELAESDSRPAQNPNLPPLHMHGDADPRPIKSWAIKHLIPACGHGLLAGQWGAGKTFVVFDLSASLMSGQPFLGHMVKRQSGVLLIAAEGAAEVRLRLEAVIRAKCGSEAQMPFCWYEDTPTLLQKGSTEKLIAMAQQAHASLMERFGLPLGLVAVDTLAACTGYSRAGEENDAAVGTAVMNVLKAVALATNCFALGVAHFGKTLEKGIRGNSSREDAGDVVLACLGERSVSGSVTNLRLAIRKHKSGPQGQEFPFTLRKVEAPEPDEDGEPVTTMVVDWLPAGTIVDGNTPGGAGHPPRDPWAETKRQDQRTAVQRLKRVLMEILADQGVDLPIPPDGPVAHMVDQELVRELFYSRTPAEGTPKQKRQLRSLQFKRALGWAEDQQLIGINEIDEVTYLRLTRPDPQDDEASDLQGGEDLDPPDGEGEPE